MSDDTTAVDEAAAATDQRREELVARFTEAIGTDAVVDTHIDPGKDLWVRVRAEDWAAAAEVVRHRMGARYFSFLSAIDWTSSPYGRSMDAEVDNIVAGESGLKEVGAPEPGITGGDTRFQVFARVANVVDHWGITLKADVPEDTLTVPTWSRTYAGADWHEREAWEMFGITFEGHIGLRHLYLPADFEGNPLRKDFPLLARTVKPWPGIVDVEPMPTTDEPEDGESSATGEEGA